MSKQRAIGTSYETSLLPALREYYPDASRAPLHGSKDTGDFILPGERRLIIEAKNHKQMKLSEWVKEAEEEAYNAWEAWAKYTGVRTPAPVGVVVHKRRGTTDPYEQYATLTLGGLLRLVHGR